MIATILLILLIIAGLFFPKSKMLFVLQGIFLFLIISFRTHDPDHYIYQVEYTTAPLVYYKTADFPGWNLWMNFWFSKGILFNQFLLIMAAICVILLLTGIYTIGVNIGGYISFTISMFLIYPLGHEATQMRTFFADTMILVVLPLLLKNEHDVKKRLINYLIYFGVVGLAATIHTLAYYFMIIGIVYIVLRSFKYELRTIIIGSVLMIILINSGVINNFILRFLNTDKQDHWIANNNLSLGKLLPIIITLFIWIIAIVEIKGISKEISNQEQLYFINVQRLMNTMFLVLPFLTYDITFNRLWRIYLILFYLITGKYIYGMKNKLNLQKLGIISLFFIMVIVIFWYENEMFVTGSMF